MHNASPDAQVVIHQTDRSAGWDSVWRWLLEPPPKNEETAVDGSSIDSGKDASAAPLTRNDDAP